VSQNKTILAHLALLSVSLIYGLTFVVAKEVMPKYLSPFGFLFWRIGIACAFFWTLSFLLGKKEKIEGGDFLRLFVSGAAGAAINMLLFFKGLSITKPINASILMMGTPIVVIVLAAIFLKEKITLKKQIGVALGILGSCIVLLFNGSFAFAQETFVGDLLVFLNAVSYGVYLITVRPLLIKYEGLTVIKWLFLFGVMVSFPFTLKEGLKVSIFSLPNPIIGYAFFVVICATIMTYLLNLFAVKHVGSTIASVYVYAQPLIASLVAISLGKDNLSPEKLIGGLCIFIGVYLVSISSNKKMKNYG